MTLCTYAIISEQTIQLYLQGRKFFDVFEGPMPAFGSVVAGYAPSPAIMQTHSDRTKPI